MSDHPLALPSRKSYAQQTMSRPTTAELNLLKENLEGLIEESTELRDSLVEVNSDYSNRLASITTLRQEADGNAEHIATLSTSSDQHFAEISEAKDASADTWVELQGFQNQLEDLRSTLAERQTSLEEREKQVEDLHQLVEGLLPGATSAGLASAFRERKESFQKPVENWSRLFLGALVGLFVIAIFNPFAQDFEVLSGTNWLDYLGGRIPIALPLIWLAIYSGRRHSQALRLEEEYAHKESLSKSFEGYKDQLLNIGTHGEGIGPTIDLINKALEALAVHPGRIYSGKHEDITPAGVVAEAVRQVVPSNNEEG